MAHRASSWYELVSSGGDVALLQEASEPPDDLRDSVEVDPGPWITAGSDAFRPWRAAIARISDRVTVQWIPTVSIYEADGASLTVSRPGTVAAAVVYVPDADPIILVSMYAVWERPIEGVGGGWIYADASVHRLISDISGLLGAERQHRIIAAGDLNVLNRYGEGGNRYWGGRYSTVFDRFEAIGLPFAGPQYPSGRIVQPRPDELPDDSLDVPTFFTNRQSAITATRQLDFVFASNSLHDSLSVRAINDPTEWGPSDHCQVEIVVE